MTPGPEVRRQTPLAIKLKDQISRAGPIPVSEFMSLCLWDETAGYYATRSGIGAAGDFITAAEISQVFGEIVGLWAAVVWKEALGGPAAVRIVEYGPGRGTMMRDIIRAGRVVPGFREAAQVHLIEMSQTLAAAQRATLDGLPVPVTWGQNLVGFETPAVVIANEFLDSWPVDQWIATDSGWRRRGVCIGTDGELAFCLIDGTAPKGLDRRCPSAAPGMIVETQTCEKMAEALGHLARTGPVAGLIIDYGYATASAGETLQAVRGHRYEHPLTSPGEADISAHVSFFELASALHQAGLAIDGPVTQSEFLGSLGIIERTSRLMHANPQRAGAIEAGVARIMAPTGMGGLFKVIGVRSPELPKLPGFSA